MIVVFALLAQSLFIVRRVAQTRSIEGQVAVQRGGAGAFIALSEGATIQNGDVIRTGAQSSAEFGWQDGTRWKVLQNSRLVIQKSLFNSLKKNEVSRLDLEQGQILVRVVKNLTSGSSFEVRTPGALVVVRGAIFSVRAQDGTTDVSVFKGRADVGLGEGGADGGTEKNGSGRTVSFSAMQSQSAHISAAKIQIGTTKNQAEFLASPGLLRPALEVESRALKDGVTLLKGQTEVGNRVSINGESVPLLGNGVFMKRMTAQSNRPNGGWKIESTDTYGATTSVVKAATAVAAMPVERLVNASFVAAKSPQGFLPKTTNPQHWLLTNP